MTHRVAPKLTLGSAIVEERIREFIVDNFAVDGRETNLGADTPLIETGIVDSMGVVEVVEFLEDEFDIEVDDEEVLPENLNSVTHIVAYVRRKQTTGGVACE
jgi:acyl carrier protein